MSELNKPVGEPDEDPDLEFRTTLRFGNKAQVKKKMITKSNIERANSQFSISLRFLMRYSESSFQKVPFKVSNFSANGNDTGVRGKAVLVE